MSHTTMLAPASTNTEGLPLTRETALANREYQDAFFIARPS
jgi:hypothetical protein